jgi:inosine/xanthosine triphosphatase
VAELGGVSSLSILALEGFKSYRNVGVARLYMGSKTVIAIGSLNPLKVRSVRRVFSRFADVEVVAVNVPTSIPRQPVGSRDIVLGALERALGALNLVPEASLSVGIEAGPMEFYCRAGFLETQVAVIIDRSCRVSIGLSPSFELDPDTVRRMMMGEELSQAVEIPRRLGDIGELIGYIGYVTQGLVTRQDLTEAAVAMALAPRIQNPEWLLSVEELAEMLNVKPLYECRKL